MAKVDRRSLIAGAVSLAACGNGVAGRDDMPTLPMPGLRQMTRVPVGCCVTTDEVMKKDFTDLLLSNFSQITPAYEMKMSVSVSTDGRFDFSRADRLVSFARQHRLRLHGSALVWYKYEPDAFVRLDRKRDAFVRLYARWIASMISRARGVASGWDVINEPVNHEGDAIRETLWSRNLGADGHMIAAFEIAARADPAAIMFINEYDLERRPAKRLVFMRLVERLLKSGAKVGGIGTQTHLEVSDLGATKRAIADLASFGLPLHVSELDISMSRWRSNRDPLAKRLADQAAVASEVAEAFMALPERQRYGITLWGLRDRESWLNKPPFDPARGDLPLAFDDAGQPKPMLAALAKALAKAPPFDLPSKQ